MRRRAWVFVLLSSCTAVALAQNPAPNQPYEPAVPPPSMYGGYGYGGGWGGGGASTVAGSAMQGMASVISAQGDYNLATSAAAVNMTQAQSNYIRNRQQWTNTYFEMRQTNAAARAQERGPRPTQEQLARIAREGVPQPLSPSQMNPVNGSLDWPSALQADQFAQQRQVIDGLVAKQSSQGSLSYADQTTARQTLDSMFSDLKKEIRNVPPPDYIACRNFLSSVMYTTTKTELN